MHNIIDVDNLAKVVEICCKANIKTLSYSGVTIKFNPQAATLAVDKPVESNLALLRQHFADRIAEEAAETQQMLDDPMGFEQDEIDRHLRGDNLSAESIDRSNQLLV